MMVSLRSLAYVAPSKTAASSFRAPCRLLHHTRSAAKRGNGVTAPCRPRGRCVFGQRLRDRPTAIELEIHHDLSKGAVPGSARAPRRTAGRIAGDRAGRQNHSSEMVGEIFTPVHAPIYSPGTNKSISVGSARPIFRRVGAPPSDFCPSVQHRQTSLASIS